MSTTTAVSVPTFKIDPETLLDGTFYTAAEKAKAANGLIRFFRGGFEPKAFTKAAYEFLHLRCGHSAHYNKQGFYHAWFSGRTFRVSLVDDLIEECSIWADRPLYASRDADLWGDVKAQFGGEEGEAFLLAIRNREQMLLAQEVEADERKMLAHLKEKYEG